MIAIKKGGSNEQSLEIRGTGERKNCSASSAARRFFWLKKQEPPLAGNYAPCMLYILTYIYIYIILYILYIYIYLYLLFIYIIFHSDIVLGKCW